MIITDISIIFIPSNRHMNGNNSMPVTIYFLTLFLFNYITLNRNVVFTVRLMPKGVLRFFFYLYDVIKIFFTIRITSDNRSSPKSIFPNNSPFIITYRNRKMYSRLNQFRKCLCRIYFRFSNSSFRSYTVSTICILIWKISSYVYNIIHTINHIFFANIIF